MIGTDVKYKKTGIDWMLEVPEHWRTGRLKRLAFVKRGASPRPIDDPIYFDDNGKYSWVRISDVTASEKYLLKTEQKLSELGASLSIKMEIGDIFLSIAGSVGKPIITDIPCCIHDGFVWFDQLNIDKNYLYYVFLGGQCFKGLGKMGTQLNLNTDTVGSIYLPIPPFEEQKTIADYLDKECSKISHFIKSKQRFIDLLKEQRQSIITHAVTKGIDDGVKMKESTLGEIPEHWKVRRLKFLANVRFSTVDKLSHKEEKKVRLCNYVDVYKNEYIRNDLAFMIATATDEEIKRFKVETGDVIITKDSETADDIAIAALVIEDLENVVCAYHLAHIKPSRNLIDSEFLFRLFQSKKINSHFEVVAKGVTRHGLSYDDINSVFLPYPPTLEEQQAINKHIKTETRTLDIAINKAEREIELIKEYREALIAEAVTGKLKM